jgi:long-chain fatty acid transport protein
MLYLSKSLIVFTFVALLSLSLFSQSSLNYGSRAKSLAGGGTALIENSLWGNMNPGGQVFLGQKVGLGIEAGIFNNSYTVIGAPGNFETSLSAKWPLGLNPGQIEAENKNNIVPQIAFNTNIGDDNAISISIYGNGNRGVNYETKTYYSPVIAGFVSSEGFINPMGTVTEPTYFKFNQYFAAFAYSRKFNDKLGIGLSIIGAWQSLSIGGLEAFGSLNYSAYPDELTNNDAANAFGVGGKLGLQWNISEQFQAGVTFRSKLYMSVFDSYKGIISESGKIDVPSEWSIGLMYQPFNRFQMILDVNRICYSGVPAWGLAMVQNNEVVFGGDNGGGFGRKDQMNYKFGLQYSIPKWSFRTGYQHSDLTIESSEVLLNILMPDIIQDYVSFGLSRKIGKQTVNFSVIKGFENTFTGINGLDNEQLIDLKSDLWNFELAVEF